ncbi:MAG TPA: GNAT family N-acetyltransferase [Steroidobacteraceae bacterium]|nr:GNAT family N-acetyltransferase [Steroidobacteraceae bacterium]
MSGARPAADGRIRPLCIDDLQRMIVIDGAHTGRSRRGFLAKRLNLALERPQAFLHVGLEKDGVLAGFALARLLRGEFGRAQTTAALDLVGVATGSQEHGVGRALLDGLLEAADQQGVRHLQSQAEWTSHALLRFFDAAGFKLANRVVLERRVSEPFVEAVEDP